MTAAEPRCAVRSLSAGEDLAGTASTVSAFLLLEHGGPWGVTALRDAPLPDGLGEALLAACRAAGARPLLVRRHRARPGVPERPRVVLAACSPAGGLAVTRRLDDVPEVAALPLTELFGELAAGTVPAGWVRTGPLLLTCTHGRHDTCCAERGRPVAAALDALAGENAWEVSHVGGDRFAGNVLVLPDGLYHGRVTPGRAAELVEATRSGRLVLDLLRGRTSFPFAVQAAEVALRRRLGLTAAAAPPLLSCARTGPRTTTTWAVGDGETWRVVVRTDKPGPARPLTCSASPSAPPVHTVVEVTDVAGPGRGAAGWDAAHGATTDPGAPSEQVTAALADLPPGRALDVGAGTGRHALWLARAGWNVTAVDFSDAGLAVGRAAAKAAGLDVDWVLGDARDYSPAPDAPGYDLVLLAFVQLPEVLEKASTWLAPGGRLVVVGHASRPGADSGGPRDPRLRHSPESLRQQASGLVVERLEEVGTDVVLVAHR